jgi:proteasome accessory factor C
MESPYSTYRLRIANCTLSIATMPLACLLTNLLSYHHMKRIKQTVLPQAKLLKLFQLIAMLKAGRWTIKQLVDRFDSSKSSMYRYLELLEESGFYVDKDFHDRYFIVTTDDDPLQAQFTLEEMHLVRALMQNNAAHPLAASVIHKLSLHSELDSMPRLFLKAHLGQLVEQLNNALRLKHRVLLKNYHSANSLDARDRLVEPIHFGDNYATLIALDVNDRQCKQFKLDRIHEVEETDHPYELEPLHERKPTDIFGFAGPANLWVTLRLSVRAYLLLREEHPWPSPTWLKKIIPTPFMRPWPITPASAALLWACWMKLKLLGRMRLKSMFVGRLWAGV